MKIKIEVPKEAAGVSFEILQKLQKLKEEQEKNQPSFFRKYVSHIFIC